MAPINVTTSKQQITANVTDDTITATVTAGIGATGATGPQGPQGPAGTTTWAGITGKPSTFAPTAHNHGNIGSDGKLYQGDPTDNSPHGPGFVVVTGADGALGMDSEVAGFYSLNLLGLNVGENGITFDDATEQTTAWTGTVAAGDVTGLAAVATSGSYSDLTNTPSAYTLPTASNSVLGGVKIGSGITITDGVISASAGYTLPNATTSTLGGVIVGTGLAVSSGTVSVSYGATSGTACQGNDSRLSDARTPLAHSHSGSDITSGTVATARLGSGTANTTTFLRGDGTWAAAGSTNASDLTSGTLAAARIGAHASAHQTGGSDAVTNVVVSPSQITGNQNDYAPGTGDIVRLSSDAARNITGITAGASGDVRVLVNVGSFTITLVHQSTSSTAGNRFLVSFGADYLLAANAAAVIVYDGTTSRWRVI